MLSLKVTGSIIRVVVQCITLAHLYGTVTVEFRPNQPPQKTYSVTSVLSQGTYHV
jgi:hypothetical protein